MMGQLSLVSKVHVCLWTISMLDDVEHADSSALRALMGSGCLYVSRIVC